jgi:hypothetical protein
LPCSSSLILILSDLPTSDFRLPTSRLSPVPRPCPSSAEGSASDKVSQSFSDNTVGAEDFESPRLEPPVFVFLFSFPAVALAATRLSGARCTFYRLRRVLLADSPSPLWLQFGNPLSRTAWARAGILPEELWLGRCQGIRCELLPVKSNPKLSINLPSGRLIPPWLGVMRRISAALATRCRSTPCRTARDAPEGALNAPNTLQGIYSAVS